jgi:hypothetical protein
MSYGVKFKLEFDDVAEKQFKLEILKFNYGGSVLDLVGGENPVPIMMIFMMRMNENIK